MQQGGNRMSTPKESKHVKTEYPASDLTSRIIATAKRVHKELGPGFEEVIYQRALALELPAHDLDYDREVWIEVQYKGKRVGKKRVDFFVEDVLVEIKAKSEFEDVDVVQTLSYLKSSGKQIALLLNFGGRSLGVKRLIHSLMDDHPDHI
jgi:GxxExxY protein